MPSVGLALLIASTLAADPQAAKVEASLGGPKLARGDELLYRGRVVEAVVRVTDPIRKTYDLTVRVFVLDAAADWTDCAVMTVVRPLDDPRVADAVSVVSGGAKAEQPPAVQLDLLRVDARGRVKRLRPAGPPPLALDKDTPTAALLPPPLDAPPGLEVGAFVPLPPAAVKLGAKWDVTEAGRPTQAWAATDEPVWNGRRCIELTATQQSEEFDAPKRAADGWKRTDTVLACPADGFASAVTREVVRRGGRDVVGSVSVSYRLEPADRYVGTRYTAARREIEAAWAFAAEQDGTAAEDSRAAMAKVDRYLADTAAATAFRPAVEAVRRRYAAAGLGSAPAVSVPRLVVTPVVDTPTVGKAAPDFLAADVDKPTGRVRLSAARGKPVLLAFFAPGSATSEQALKLCEAVRAKFDGATVLPLTAFGESAAAARQRADLTMTLPVYAGADAAAAYQVKSVPQFFLIDSAGVLRWTFDAGIGGETGYLIRKQLEPLLAERAEPRR